MRAKSIVSPLLSFYTYIRRRLFSGYFSLLLLCLVLLFFTRPYERGHLYMAIWEIFLFFTFLSAIFNCTHSRRVRWAALALGVPALVIEWLNLLFFDHRLAPYFLFLTIAFIALTASSIIKYAILSREVKAELLRGVVCAHMMIGLGFAFLYLLLELLIPGSFTFGGSLQQPSITHGYFLSEMIYFSFVVLLCIGFGDITASHNFSQIFVIAEGMVGQFYIAILVARLVTIYAHFGHKPLFNKELKSNPELIDKK